MAVYIIKTKTIFFSKINGLISKYSDTDVYWETLYKEGEGGSHTIQRSMTFGKTLVIVHGRWYSARRALNERW